MRLNSSDLDRLIRDHGATLILWTAARSELAEDIVQEAFCRLAIEDPPPANCVAWLYTVCRNLAGNERLRRRRQIARERSISRPEKLDLPPEANAERQELMAAVGRIRPELRTVLIARIWGQLRFEEVAQVCEISTATAFRRYEAALAELRSLLLSPDRKEHVRTSID